jgi:hypothetical protein
MRSAQSWSLRPRALCAAVLCALTVQTARADTHWRLEPSLPYDALCLLNVLTGDSFYQIYYPRTLERWSGSMTPQARSALADLHRILKDEHGQIISAFLTLYYSANNPRTIDDLIADTEHPAKLHAALEATTYYSDDGWATYDKVRPALAVVFHWMKSVGFERYWTDSIRPRVDRRITQLRVALDTLRVIDEDQRLLGHPLGGDTITVYVLAFSQPHGIRITGTRFLTDIAWPAEIVARNAVHEMLHPPFDLAHDTTLSAAIHALAADTFVVRRVENHDKSFGYNSLAGLVEEDVVQAFEQYVNGRFGIAVDWRGRWSESDGGIHVLAPIIYDHLRRGDFSLGRDSIGGFVLRLMTTGDLRPGFVAAAYARVMRPAG